MKLKLPATPKTFPCVCESREFCTTESPLGKSFFGAKHIVQNPGHAVSWHIASLRGDAAISRFRSEAEMGKPFAEPEFMISRPHQEQASWAHWPGLLGQALTDRFGIVLPNRPNWAAFYALKVSAS